MGIEHSICIIQGQDRKTGKHCRSNGVFITPFDVITAFHCVNGLKDIRVSNIQGG
jgi:hypothetical protein